VSALLLELIRAFTPTVHYYFFMTSGSKDLCG